MGSSSDDGSAEGAARIAALEARVALLEAVIEGLPDPVFVKDEQHRFVLVNRRCAQFTGHAVQDMLGRTDADFFPPEQVAWFLERDRAVLESDIVDEQVEKLSDADAQLHLISTRKSRALLPDGRQLVVGTIRDISQAIERAARQEAQLHATLAVLEQLTAMLPVGIAHVDAEGRFTYAFGPDLRAMGITSDKLVGTSVHDLAPLWPELLPLVERALAGRVVSRVLDWRGRARHVHVAPTLDAEGQPRGATMVSVDVTEQREREKRAAHGVRMDSLGRLAGGVAHELNNLLSIVMMGTSVLRDALAASERDTAMAQVRLLERSIERGSRLSRQLASFARRQVGPLAIVALHDHMRPVQVFLESLVGDGVGLDFSLCEEEPRVRLLPGQVEQLLINLVLHAAAGSRGGRVRVETATLDLATDPELRPGRYVAIRVRDEAPTLPSADRERLFEPFFDPDGRGASLGLATCYGIAVQAGGRVRALAGDAGNLTEVLLPLTEDEPSTAAEPPQVRARARRGVRVLLVEDEEILRSQVEQLLVTAGHRVVFAAADGRDALDWYEENADQVDIVVSDVVMPRLSGIDLAERLEGRVPIILLTGYVGDSHSKVAELGARFQVLMKPVRPDELLHAVQQELAEAR